jgi:hypothetical protein
MMVAATAIVLALSFRHRDVISPLVVVWAVVGIIVKFPEEVVMRSVGGLMLLTLLAGVGRVIWLARSLTAPPA